MLFLSDIYVTSKSSYFASALHRGLVLSANPDEYSLINNFISKFTSFLATFEVNSSKNRTCSFPAYGSPHSLQAINQL